MRNTGTDRMNDIAKIEVRAGRIGARKILAETLSKSFSQSFSNGVSNGSSKQCRSYLNLLQTSRNFSPRIGHELPDSDPRLHSELRVQQGFVKAKE